MIVTVTEGPYESLESNIETAVKIALLIGKDVEFMTKNRLRLIVSESDTLETVQARIKAHEP